ncbi:MAG: outer membrane protein assembly factor BamE [Thiohalomonadaceae bacterium]|jgi:outer membrane protein assembly factor BamE
MQKIIILVLLAMQLAACAYVPDIQQGNMVTQDKLAQLQIGMDKRQVTYIMGPAMLTDPFHANRWDYFYSFTPGSKSTTRYGATLYFDNERLIRIDIRGEIPSTEYPDKAKPVF